MSKVFLALLIIIDENLILFKCYILVLGSKLDSDIHKNICRLAFDGKLIHTFQDKNYQLTDLTKLKIYKVKQKQGVVERLVNDYELVCKNMFKKETNIHLFSGLIVILSTGEKAVIDGPFGQSGKFKIRLKGMLMLLLWRLTLKTVPSKVISVRILLFFVHFRFPVRRSQICVKYQEKETQ